MLFTKDCVSALVDARENSFGVDSSKVYDFDVTKRLDNVSLVVENYFHDDVQEASSADGSASL